MTGDAASRTKDDDRRKPIRPSAWGAGRAKKRPGRIRFSPCLRGENLRILERIFEVNQRCVRESVYCVLIDNGGHNERLSCEVLKEGAWRKWPRSRRLPVLLRDACQHPRRGGGKS